MSGSERIAIEALDGIGSGLRAIFMRSGDVFEHAIVAVQDERETPLLYCDHLPLQEIVDHRTFDGRQALLATGAGDGRYWSISVDLTVDVRLAVLGFDVACHDSPEWPAPAARYRVADNVTLEGDDLLLVDGRRFATRSGALPVSNVAESVPTCRIEASPGQLAFSSSRSPRIPTSKMARWRYEFQFVRPL